MPIEYYLQPNYITPDPNDQIARIVPGEVLTLPDITKKMIQRGTMVTETDALAVLNLFFKVVMDEVAEGNFVNLTMVNIRPTIGGVFPDISAPFDKSKNYIDASVYTSTEFSGIMQNARLDRVSQGGPSPELTGFLDLETSTVNSKATPGGIAEITGSELKYDASDVAEGVFFIDTVTGAEIKAPTTGSKRTEGKLIFIIPTLSPARYYVEVRRKYTQSKQLRTGHLPISLLVA